jgi:hypothetical protein
MISFYLVSQSQIPKMRWSTLVLTLQQDYRRVRGCGVVVRLSSWRSSTLSISNPWEPQQRWQSKEPEQLMRPVLRPPLSTHTHPDPLRVVVVMVFCILTGCLFCHTEETVVRGGPGHRSTRVPRSDSWTQTDEISANTQEEAPSAQKRRQINPRELSPLSLVWMSQQPLSPVSTVATVLTGHLSSLPPLSLPASPHHSLSLSIVLALSIVLPVIQTIPWTDAAMVQCLKHAVVVCQVDLYGLCAEQGCASSTFWPNNLGGIPRHFYLIFATGSN